MASIGGDVAGDDWDDFEVGTLESHTTKSDHRGNNARTWAVSSMNCPARLVARWEYEPCKMPDSGSLSSSHKKTWIAFMTHVSHHWRQSRPRIVIISTSKFMAGVLYRKWKNAD